RTLRQSREYIELGHDEVGDPVDACRVARDRSVVPARATRAARGGAELETLGAQPLFVSPFTIPMPRSIRPGPMPEPVDAPPAVELDDVTNGYVPWSTSSMVACPPSNTTVLPASSAWFSSRPVSTTIGRSRSAYESRSFTTSSTLIARRL